jgi:hypothetical protein
VTVMRWTLAVVVAAGLVAGTAAAAPLGVTSAQLTVDSEAVSLTPTTCTLDAAAADSYVSETELLANFGTATTLEVRALLLGNRRTFVRFDLGGCSISSGARVTSATLGLYMTSAPSAGRTQEARRVTAVWTEGGITWASQPLVALTPTATTTTGTTSGVRLTWEVTSDVQAFVDGTTNHGWRVADTGEGSVAERRAVFSSAENGAASERPTLTISYFP